MQLDKSHLKTALTIVKRLFTPASFFFIFYFSWLNRELLSEMLAVVDPIPIIFAIFLWGLLHALAPLSPKLIFESLGVELTYSELLGIHISRLPARYLPGGIWHTVGRISDYFTLGITKKQLAIFALIETLFPCIITLMIGGGYLWMAGTHHNQVISNIEGLLACISLLLLITLPVILKIRFSVYLKSKFYRNYFFLIIISVFFWANASISFLFYYTAVSLSLSQMPLPDIAATYIFSWGIGYISIFAPQGIGVLEFVAGNLMELPISLGGAVAFLAGFRVVAFAADGLSWSIYKLVMMFNPKKELH